MLELDEIKKLHDKAYGANQSTRESASDDLIFYHVTQWSDDLLEDSQLSYKGQFDVLRKAGRQIIADLRLNPVQPDFKPKDESRTDDAEIMDGLYRTDDRALASQEAYDYASQDAVVCGFGAWELYTDYETNRVGDNNQVIKRRYIPEANNTVFFDPNSYRLDKSDCNYVSILKCYSEDGYKELVNDLTGQDIDEVNIQSFSNPEQSYSFPWTSQQRKFYVSTFYHRKKVKDKVLTLEDAMGQPLLVRESDLKDEMDDLIELGYKIVDEKTIKRWEITRYVASGNEVLSTDKIAGEFIPVIPVYGEHVPQVEGVECWSGITRLAKDPQRLRNFQMSYLADIVSRSPRQKPIFAPEQIQGFEFMYDESGADNNYPYLLANRKDGSGEELPIGAIAVMPEQPIPQALAASIELTRQAVEDVANPGITQDISDPTLSGKAINALQSRMDQQSYIYQHNFKHAKKRDAEIYAGMASIVYDAPRTVMIETADGNTKSVQMMSIKIDSDSGEPIVLNDLTNMEFDVYAEVGQSYQTQKEQTLDKLTEMISSLSEVDPLRNILLMKALEIMPGVKFDDVRDYARKQLIVLGIKEPETQEEMQLLQESQQQDKPDANMALAQAEQTKADAAMMREQRTAQKDMAEIQLKSGKLEVDQYKAETDRAAQEVDAAIAGVGTQKTISEVENINIDSQLKKLSGAQQMHQGFRARVN